MAETLPNNATESQESILRNNHSGDKYLAPLALALQTAVSEHDRSQAAQLLPILLQQLSASPQQRHIPMVSGLQLLQLAAQALNLSSGNHQVPNTYDYAALVSTGYLHQPGQDTVRACRVSKQVVKCSEQSVRPRLLCKMLQVIR